MLILNIYILELQTLLQSTGMSTVSSAKVQELRVVKRKLALNAKAKG